LTSPLVDAELAPALDLALREVPRMPGISGRLAIVADESAGMVHRSSAATVSQDSIVKDLVLLQRVPRVHLEGLRVAILESVLCAGSCDPSGSRLEHAALQLLVERAANLHLGHEGLQARSDEPGGELRTVSSTTPSPA
jgi:hypothetical protein